MICTDTTDRPTMTRPANTLAPQPICAATAHAIGRRFCDGDRPDHEAAFAWYSRAAVAGHAPSMTRLAEALAEGRGVLRDPAAALRWYRRAAAAGDAEAIEAIGWIRRHLDATIAALAHENGNNGQSHAS